MKPIHKFNNGNGATLCNQCSVIISVGLTDDLYCKECKDHREKLLIEIMKEDEDLGLYIEQMEKEEPKQETTLEEVAERLYPIYDRFKYDEDWVEDVTKRRDDFIAGAKWQMDNQDEFAIGFADWCKQEYDVENTPFHNKWVSVNGNYFSTKELLEIYKKEKGL